MNFERKDVRRLEKKKGSGVNGRDLRNSQAISVQLGKLGGHPTFPECQRAVRNSLSPCHSGRESFHSCLRRFLCGRPRGRSLSAVFSWRSWLPKHCRGNDCQGQCTLDKSRSETWVVCPAIPTMPRSQPRRDPHARRCGGV